jgi:hypothetical protein
MRSAVRRRPVADAPIQFHPLSFVPERNEAEVLVGRPDSESFAVFDADDAALLRRMADGMHPEEAATWYQANYGQTVDMPDFLATLTELGFIRQEGEENTAAGKVRYQRLGKILFSPLSFACLAAVTTCWIIVILRHPQLAPNPRQVFFTNSVLLVQFAVIFLQIPWIGIHEAAHVLAGRRLGLPSRLGISTRLYFVVFETRMNGLLTVPRRKRYLPILAGMAMDIFVISGLGLIAFALIGPGGSEPLAGRILLAMTFPILVRCGYQFLLFLQTDIYFVIATWLGCHDLHAAAKAVIRNRLRRLPGWRGPLVDESQWTERDQRIARWYAPFFLVGGGILIVIGVLVVIPILGRALHLLAQGLRLSPSDGHFWANALFIALNLFQFGLLAVVAVRKRMRAKEASGHVDPVAQP